MKNIEKAMAYLRITVRPTGAQSSVRNGNCTRFIKAQEQASKKPKEIKEIIHYTNEYLELLEMNPIKNPIFKKEERDKDDFYDNIQKTYQLKNKCDIVWMKFTKDGFLGVVAVSADINFNMPSLEENDSKKPNTSGIMIHHLGKKWDERFVLVFPLQNIPKNLKRGDIERGIGNYLIEKDVPILDFYSHRY